MTTYTLAVAYGSFVLTGEPAGADFSQMADCGSFTLTGEPVGVGPRVFAPIVSDGVWLRNPIVLSWTITVQASFVFGATPASLVTYGPAIDEAMTLNSAASNALIWSYLASDRVSIAQTLQLAFGASCSETLTLSQTSSLALAITLAQTLFLSDPVTTTLKFNISVAEAIWASTAFGNFLGASVSELANFSGTTSQLWEFAATASDGVVLSDVAGGSLLINITSSETADFADAEVLRYIFSPTVAEGVQITAGHISPSGNFTAWAVNTRTTAVTEYRNFTFDSFAQVGLKCVAGDTTGLYELDGESDAGSPIVADILSGFMQLGGSKFTAFKAAYLGLSSQSGQFILKLITGDDQTYIYSVVAHNMRSTRVNFGKGLRSRYFRFELQNIDGKDFSLNDIEFLPLVSTRRF